MVVCRLFSAVPFWRSAVCFRPALHPFSGGGFRPPSWAEIAALRCVEVVTVKTQIKGLLSKFGCSRSKEIVQMIRQLGLEHLF